MTSSPDSPQPPSRLQAGNIFRLLYEADPGGNVLFSPLSAEIILTVLLAGLSGESERAIRDLLQLDETDAEILLFRLAADLKTLRESLPRTELDLPLALWHQITRVRLRPHLEEMLRDALALDVRATDFRMVGRAQEELNDWVANATRNKIQNFPIPARPTWVPADQPFPIFMGANAIYLKAKWLSPLSAYRFGTDFFHCADGSEREVFFMEYCEFEGLPEMGYLRRDDFHALRMPFEDESLAMEVFLPFANDGLPGMVAQLSSENVDDPDGGFGKCPHLYLLMPVFEVNAFVSFGMGRLGRQLAPLFRPGSDFDGMFRKEIEEEPLGLGDVAQSLTLRADETGVEAAAVTVFFGGGVGGRMHIQEEELVMFEADHPFYYRIRHLDTGRVLFEGTLCRPELTGDPDEARGRTDAWEHYFQRCERMGLAGKIALEVSLVYRWLQGLELDAPGLIELLEAAWRWAHDFHREGSDHDFFAWQTEHGIDPAHPPENWYQIRRDKNGSERQVPMRFLLRDILAFLQEDNYNLFRIGFLMENEYFRGHLAYSSIQKSGGRPDLSLFEAFDQDDESSRSRRPALGAISRVQAEMQARPITARERRQRIAYRKAIPLIHEMQWADADDWKAWGQEMLAGVLEKTGLKGSLWADLGEPGLWKPLTAALGEHNLADIRKEWDKETAEGLCEALVAAGRSRPQAVNLVREAIRYPFLVRLAGVVLDGQEQFPWRLLPLLGEELLEAGLEI